MDSHYYITEFFNVTKVCSNHIKVKFKNGGVRNFMFDGELSLVNAPSTRQISNHSIIERGLYRACVRRCRNSYDVIVSLQSTISF